jgi:AcrR family transcriptional regulator
VHTEVIMKKSQAISDILEHAIRVFATTGYRGASLRQIAADAGVPLSTINAYFGCKASLYEASKNVVWNEIASERDAALAELRRRHPHALPIEDVLTAIVSPVMCRALSDEPAQRDRLYFMIALWQTDFPSVDAFLRKTVDATATRWIKHVADACPELEWSDAVWAFYYSSSVMFSWPYLNRRCNSLLEAERARSAEFVTREVVAFCASGIRGMIELGAKGPRRQVAPSMAVGRSLQPHAPA